MSGEAAIGPSVDLRQTRCVGNVDEGWREALVKKRLRERV